MAVELEHEKVAEEKGGEAPALLRQEIAQLQLKMQRQMQRNIRWVLAAASVVVLVSGGLVWVVLANNARQLADQSRQLQAQAAKLDESRSQLAASRLQLQHAQANVFAELSRSKLAQDEFDSAFRFALRGTKIDLDLPPGVVQASRAGAALAAAAFRTNWVFSLGSHEKLVASTAFSPDGERVVTASGDRTARVWNVRVLTMSTTELVKETCARLVGISKFTRDEMRLAGDPESMEEIDVCKP